MRRKNEQIFADTSSLVRQPVWQGDGCCDLLICDEAHRLKVRIQILNMFLIYPSDKHRRVRVDNCPSQNPQSGTSMALASLKCTRRVLLTGTPMQNDLDEFFAMVRVPC